METSVAMNGVLQSKRHKELLEAFNKIAPVNGTPEMVKAISELRNDIRSGFDKKIESFVAAVRSIPQPSVNVAAPNVKVEPAKLFFSQEKLERLAQEILDTLNEIKKPVEWVHEVTRDRDGMISKITSKVKK